MVFEELPALADADVIERLTQVKGIGVWTVHMFLIFALRRHDVLPMGDLGDPQCHPPRVQLAELPTPAEMETDRGALAALLLGRELVSVAEPGSRTQICEVSGN